MNDIESIFRNQRNVEDLIGAIEKWMLGAFNSSSSVNENSMHGQTEYVQLETKDILDQLYLSLLGRKPDPSAIAHYLTVARTEGGIKNIIVDILGSKEFREYYRRISMGAACLSDRISEESLVFIHIQKTGGTSLQNILRDSYGNERLYMEHADTLYFHAPVDLAQYDVFMGHFNYDSVRLIPKHYPMLITFLREPVARLQSLYNFWRLHKESSPWFHSGMDVAGKFSFVEFLDFFEKNCNSDVWNHMTWAVMGDVFWRGCTEAVMAGEHRKSGWLENFRDDAKARLREFGFIGLTEDYSNGLARLSMILGERNLAFRHDHSFETVKNSGGDFRPNTSRDVKNYSSLGLGDRTPIFLDKILYQEATEIYRDGFTLRNLRRKVI